MTRMSLEIHGVSTCSLELVDVEESSVFVICLDLHRPLNNWNQEESRRCQCEEALKSGSVSQ